MASCQPRRPIFTAPGFELYADDANAAALGSHPDLTGYLRAHFNRLGAGDYAALLAYIQRDPDTIAALQKPRVALRDAKHVATVAEFGPRFLHSTGQAYKGGPNSGVFLQITADDAQDLPVPGHKYGFSAVKAAQARGDLHVLNERHRLALRIHFKQPVMEGLAALDAAITEALA